MLLQRPVLGSDTLLFQVFSSHCTRRPSLIQIWISSFVRLQNIFCEYGVPVVYFALYRTSQIISGLDPILNQNQELFKKSFLIRRKHFLKPVVTVGTGTVRYRYRYRIASAGVLGLACDALQQFSEFCLFYASDTRYLCSILFRIKHIK